MIDSIDFCKRRTGGARKLEKGEGNRGWQDMFSWGFGELNCFFFFFKYKEGKERRKKESRVGIVHVGCRAAWWEGGEGG